MKHCRLNVEFLGYWHVGCGRGEGTHLDAIVDKDPDGLPFVPGRMLKGLLRDALRRLDAWGQADTEGCLQLFGGFPVTTESSRHDTQPGLIRVGDARLSEEMRRWLAHVDQAPQRQALYRQIFSTAIDEATGGARKESLRGIEVVVPLSLTAEIEIAGEQAEHHFARIQRALPLIRAMGAHRSRGLGRARLGFEEIA